MATSTALAYRVDSTLFSNTCIVMATGQVLVKVPQEPGFNIYTIMYEAEGGVTGEIVIHSGKEAFLYRSLRTPAVFINFCNSSLEGATELKFAQKCSS